MNHCHGPIIRIVYVKSVTSALVLTQNDPDNSDLNIQKILNHELFSSPLSLFNADGEMRISKSKSSLKNKLIVEMSSRTTMPKIRIVDASAVLWTISWPSNGALVKDFVANVRHYLENLLTTGDVYFVFDRYFERSIKNSTRSSRANGITRRYELCPQKELPAKKTRFGGRR